MTAAVPPFSYAPAKDVNTDWLSKSGAQELCRRIRNAWLKLGHDVLVYPELMPRNERDPGKPQYVVRSELVNGLPRRDAPTVRPPADMHADNFKRVDTGRKRSVIEEMEG